MEYIIYARLSSGKYLTGGIVDAKTPLDAIDIVKRKYIAQGEKYGPVNAIAFEAQEAPADEDELCQ